MTHTTDTSPAPDGGLKHRAVRGVAWTTINVVGSRLITAVVFILLARLLEPEAFGLVALSLVFVSFTSMLIDQGLGSALVQRKELGKEHLDTTFWMTLATGVALAGLLIAAAGPMARLLGTPELAPVIRALSLTLVLGAAASAPTAVLRRDLGFRSLAKRRLLATLVGGVAGVAAAFAGWGVWSLVTQALTQSVVGAAALWLVTPYRPGLQVSRRAFHDLFGFSNKVIGINIVNFVSRRSDDLLIGSVLGPAALGLYSVAYRLLTIMTEALSLTIDAVAFPTFSRLQHDRRRLQRAYETAIRSSLTLAAPAYLAVAVLAPDVVPVLFGEGWSQSVPVMQVLALAGVVQAVWWSNNSLLLSLGQARTALRVNTTMAVCNVIGFVIAVQFGILAVAVAFTVRAYLLAPLSVAPVKRALGFTWWGWARPLLPPVVAALVMAACLQGTRVLLLEDASRAVRVGVSPVLGGLVYVAVLALLAPAQTRELLALVTSALPGRSRRAADPEPP